MLIAVPLFSPIDTKWKSRQETYRQELIAKDSSKYKQGNNKRKPPRGHLNVFPPNFSIQMKESFMEGDAMAS